MLFLIIQLQEGLGYSALEAGAAMSSPAAGDDASSRSVNGTS